jgi:3'(2'), 5'-bisphosphate nucleotidase
LNKINLKSIAEDLIETFIEAGEVAKKISLNGVKITIKPDNSPVTDGDLAVDTILTTKIKSITPDIPIISEETANLEIKNNNQNFWLIDPIDGTKDYIKKKDEYTLNAALIMNLIPVMGLVYAPKKDRLFFSYGPKQAFEINEGKRKILNCEKKNTNKVVALTNSDKMQDNIMNIYKTNKVTEIIRMSSSLKFCILAAGEADIYAATARAYEWDIAAGHVVLEHAGGSVTGHDGEKFLYGKSNYKNIPIIAKRSSLL